MRTSWLIALIGIAACAAAGSEPSYQTLDAKGEPLRAAFDQAEGKVRAIFLASPT